MWSIEHDPDEKIFDPYDNISPIDYRYVDWDARQLLSENAFIKTKLEVEVAFLEALVKHDRCPPDVVEHVREACKGITAAMVMEEECKTRHDIRALVNCIRARVPESSRPYIHLSMTSFDVIDTANVLRYQRFVKRLLLPSMKELLQQLVMTMRAHSDTLQIGRTHGQHAEPITFGYMLAGYACRLLDQTKHVSNQLLLLAGKCSGAVGAYNAQVALGIEDPEEFEKDMLRSLGLGGAHHTTQIVPPEPTITLVHHMQLALGVIAGLADDLRHLQRTEISEVCEGMSKKQVGSSTMPHKKNPIGCEQVKSLHKIVLSRFLLCLLDQTSEHQRDLTNSASSRTAPEVFAYTLHAFRRMKNVLARLGVDKERMYRNAQMMGDHILAEPLYVFLASNGHPDAHETARELVKEAQAKHVSLSAVVTAHDELKPYVDKFTQQQRSILAGTYPYTGLAAKRTLDLADMIENTLEWAV